MTELITMVVAFRDGSELIQVHCPDSVAVGSSVSSVVRRSPVSPCVEDSNLRLP